MHVYVREFLFQYVKDRASRIQSESSLSGFVEAPPIFATTQRAPRFLFRSANLHTIFEGSMALKRAFPYYPVISRIIP